ncbi:MAG TPA: DNA recombination protein RmuC [Candidatus Tectomicrobia bacterium]|nr:DNA recombination protein RmuC [Candidatus Tectomicrobia bacterium]
MLELLIIGSLGAITMALLVWHLHRLWQQPSSDLIERVQFLSEGLLNLQRTLDARLDHSTQALNTSLVTGLTQLTTQLVSRVDSARLDSQMAMEERLRAVQHEVQRQLDTLRTTIQDSLSDSRRELFGMMTAVQQGVEQRLRDNSMQHSTLFRDVAEKLGEIRVTNERIVAISQDINQLSRILESPKPRGNVGEFELERMLSNVLPSTLYHMQAAVGEALVDAVIVLEGGSLCIDSKFPLDNFRRMVQPDVEPETRHQWHRLFLGDVRRHVADIAHKYIQPPATLDFALMFIPAENVYYEVLLSDETLEFARSKRVVPVSPNTLYAYLQAISIGFRGLKIAQETRRIEQLLLGLKKNFDEFKEHFRLIGRHLDRARGQFIQAESDVTRFDHTIGGIQFGTLNEQLPLPTDENMKRPDVEPER